MTTSNSTDFNQSALNIITDALQLIGRLGAGESASSDDISFCLNILNKMVKGWQAQGIHLWKECEAVILLTNDQNKYTLSSSSTDKMGDNPVITSLTAEATSTTLTVSSTSGISAADNISIELDNNTIHNTTIVSVDSSTQLTITSAVASTASSGNTVVTYTTRSGKPLNIINARYKYKNGIERKIRKMGRSEFMALPNKDQNGVVNAYYYSPQLNNGLLYVWMTPDTVGDLLLVSYIKTIEDFDASSDNPDFPSECLDCLTANLSVRVAPAFGISLSKENPDLIVSAKELLADMQAWDSEEGSVRIIPNNRYDN